MIPENSSFGVINKAFETLLNQLKKPIGGDGDGYDQFNDFLRRTEKKYYSRATLNNYRNGIYGKKGSQSQYKLKKYLALYRELEPLIETYLKDWGKNDLFAFLDDTCWAVYFLNWDPKDNSYCIGQAKLKFSRQGRDPYAELINLPNSEDLDKKGVCKVHKSVISLYLENDEVDDSFLTATLDISGDLKKHEILLGGYQSMEDRMIMMGTLLLKRIKNETEFHTKSLSFNKNRKDFLALDKAIREFLFQRSRNLLKVFHNPGSVDGLQSKIDKYRSDQKSRLIDNFVEPDVPVIFFSCPVSEVKNHEDYKMNEENLNELTTKLEEELNSSGEKKIEIFNIRDQKRNKGDYLPLFNQVKQASIFVLIYPDYGTSYNSTSLVELGWAFMAAKRIFVYSNNNALSGRLTRYLSFTDESITFINNDSASIDYNEIYEHLCDAVLRLYSS